MTRVELGVDETCLPQLLDEEALFDTVEGALDVGLQWMTVYAFSTENWRRPLEEVRFLMRFNESLLLRRRDDLDERGVRVRFIGRRGGRVPKRVLRHIEDTEELTRRNRRMTLTFAFNYGGRAEIVDIDAITASTTGTCGVVLSENSRKVRRSTLVATVFVRSLCLKCVSQGSPWIRSLKTAT